MKAEMTADGRLSITPETGVEAYALRKWREEKGVLFVDDKIPEPVRTTGAQLRGMAQKARDMVIP